MRYNEITAPATHPYIALVTIDPIDFARLQHLTEDRPEVTLLDCDDTQADLWSVRIGCASEAVADRLEEGWG